VTEKIRSAYGWDPIDDAKKVMELVFSEDRDGFEEQTNFQARPARPAEPDRGRPPSPAKAAVA